MLRLILLLLTLAVTLPAHAHEVRPAYLEITERLDGRIDVLWKQPSVGNVAIALRPSISGGLIDHPPDTMQSTGSFAVARWHDVDLAGKAPDGREVAVKGLEHAITDVLSVVRFANGHTTQRILTPETPQLTIDAHAGAPAAT